MTTDPTRGTLFLGRMDGGASWLAPSPSELLEHLAVTYLFEGDICTTDVFFYLDGPFWEAWNDDRGMNLIAELLRSGGLRPMFRESATTFRQNLRDCTQTSWGVRPDAEARARDLDRIVGSGFASGVWQDRMAHAFFIELARAFDSDCVNPYAFEDERFKRVWARIDEARLAIEEAATTHEGRPEITRARFLGAFGQRVVGFPHEKVQRPADLVAYTRETRPQDLEFVESICQFTCEAYQASHARSFRAAPVFPNVWVARGAGHRLLAPTEMPLVGHEETLGTVNVTYPAPDILLSLPAGKLVKLRDEFGKPYLDLVQRVRYAPVVTHDTLGHLQEAANRYSAALSEAAGTAARDQLTAQIHLLAPKPALAALIAAGGLATAYGDRQLGLVVMGAATLAYNFYLWTKISRRKSKRIPIRRVTDMGHDDAVSAGNERGTASSDPAP